MQCGLAFHYTATVAGYCLAYVTEMEISKTIPAQGKRQGRTNDALFFRGSRGRLKGQYGRVWDEMQSQADQSHRML